MQSRMPFLSLNLSQRASSRACPAGREGNAVVPHAIHRDKHLREIVFREAFEELWAQGARSVDEMIKLMERKH